MNGAQRAGPLVYMDDLGPNVNQCSDYFFVYSSANGLDAVNRDSVQKMILQAQGILLHNM